MQAERYRSIFLNFRSKRCMTFYKYCSGDIDYMYNLLKHFYLADISHHFLEKRDTNRCCDRWNARGVASNLIKRQNFVMLRPLRDSKR